MFSWDYFKLFIHTSRIFSIQSSRRGLRFQVQKSVYPITISRQPKRKRILVYIRQCHTQSKLEFVFQPLCNIFIEVRQNSKKRDDIFLFLSIILLFHIAKLYFICVEYSEQNVKSQFWKRTQLYSLLLWRFVDNFTLFFFRCGIQNRSWVQRSRWLLYECIQSKQFFNNK